jgi:alkaline phosphatase
MTSFLPRIALLCSAGLALAQSPAPNPKGKAKNIILFLADAGGVPTLNAASILGYQEPQKLFVQSWKSIGLSDTSTASQWVTDSAAGMTAIVTGQKTHNGVISMGPDTERGKKDGAPLKTILEYAEERGLSTGVVSNVNIADATPAACYAQSNDRRKLAEIFSRIFAPRFGDGPDVVLGVGRDAIWKDAKAKSIDIEGMARAKGRTVHTSLEAVPEGEKRPIAVLERGLDVPAATRLAIRTLSANRKGYFLMIEWDAHTDDPERGLGNVVAFDKLIREVAGMVNQKETLLVFTADHSFDLRVRGGLKLDPVLKGFAEWSKTHKPSEEVVLPALRVGHDHTGEEVLVAALGPGSAQVSGFMPNTRIFEVMMNAYGWKPTR